jgi:hypothetical protein
MMCSESTTTVYNYGSGPYLSLDQSVHDVSRWEGNVVTISEVNLCSDESFELNGDSSTLVHDVKPTGATNPVCKPMSGEVERPEHYELSKGFDVYWAMRQSFCRLMRKAL